MKSNLTPMDLLLNRLILVSYARLLAIVVNANIMTSALAKGLSVAPQ